MNSVTTSSALPSASLNALSTWSGAATADVGPGARRGAARSGEGVAVVRRGGVANRRRGEIADRDGVGGRLADDPDGSAGADGRRTAATGGGTDTDEGDSDAGRRHQRLTQLTRRRHAARAAAWSETRLTLHLRRGGESGAGATSRGRSISRNRASTSPGASNGPSAALRRPSPSWSRRCRWAKRRQWAQRSRCEATASCRSQRSPSA